MRYVVILALVVVAACSSNTTIITTVASTPTPTAASTGSTAASPSTEAIDKACASLTVQFHVVHNSLSGKSGNSAPEDFTEVERALDKTVPALIGTDAGESMRTVVTDANDVSIYIGTNLGPLLDKIGVFVKDAKSFYN